MEPTDKASASHQLASHVGVMAADLQLRKASFFGDEDLGLMWKGDEKNDTLDLNCCSHL